jgi:shikimate kinase
VTEFIRREFAVQDSGKSTTIRQDEAPARPGEGGRAFYIIGLSGSGKSAVAAFLARELGLPARELPLEAPDEALSAILAEGPAVVAVPHKLLASEGFRQRLQQTGRVLYLMAGAETIAARTAASPEEEARVRAALGRQRTAFEPLFMQTLHLLVPADAPLAEVQADALERVRM